MVIKRNMSWQYIAGFFDGEGNIHIYDNSRKRSYRDNPTQRHKPGKIYDSQDNRVTLSVSQAAYFRISMIQQENGVLEKIKLFLEKEGIKTSLRKVLTKGKINKQGITTTQDIKTLAILGGHQGQLQFLEGIYPYAHVKLPKIILALEFIRNREWGKHSFHERGFKQWRGLRSIL